MKIESKPYGEIEVDPSKTITLQGGLYGFEDSEDYVIVGKEDEQPFEWLQSLDDPNLAFVVTDPRIIRPDYQLSVRRADLQDIDVDTTEDVLSYVIVVVPDDPKNMTVNLQGPLIINQSTFFGKQVINQVDAYGVRHRVLDEIKESSAHNPLKEGGPA